MYNEEKDELEKNFIDTKKTSDQRTYKYEVLIAFWLSIHLSRLQIAQMIHDLDPILEKILSTLRRKGRDLLEEERQKKQAKIKGKKKSIQKSDENLAKGDKSSKSSMGGNLLSPSKIGR